MVLSVPCPSGALRDVAFALCLALLAGPGALPAAAAKPPSDTVATRWQAQAADIGAGTDSAARAAAVTARLDAMGVAWQAETFARDGHRAAI